MPYELGRKGTLIGDSLEFHLGPCRKIREEWDKDKNSLSMGVDYNPLIHTKCEECEAGIKFIYGLTIKQFSIFLLIAIPLSFLTLLQLTFWPIGFVATAGIVAAAYIFVRFNPAWSR